MTNKYVYENIKSQEPTVGMGATEVMFSDRHAYTVIEVLTAKKVVVQQDNAYRLDRRCRECKHRYNEVNYKVVGNLPCPECGGKAYPEMSDGQTYKFEPNPDGHKVTIRLHKNGRWYTTGGTVYVLGGRSEHYDYSF